MSLSEDQLVGQYAPMVRRLALQLISKLPPSVELDDLMQALLLVNMQINYLLQCRINGD